MEKIEMGGACSTYGKEANTRFLWGNPRERDHLEDQGVDGRIILKCIFKKWDVVAGTSSILGRIGTVCGHL
jgi:hypothetical protein